MSDMDLVANDKRVTVPPTFHPLPSLLNLIDFESESETDKTTHIRKRLHFSDQQMHAITDHTHTTWFVPPLDIQMRALAVAALPCWETKYYIADLESFHSCHPSAFVQVSSSSRDRKRPAGQVCVGEASPNWPNTNETAGRWKMPTRNVETYGRESYSTESACRRGVAWWRTVNRV